MRTSSGNFPRRATKIDDLTRRDHYFLDRSDKCVYIGEYTARAGYQHSQTNQLISNLKKGLERRNKPDWGYKADAIGKAANAFRAVLSKKVLDEFTFVPIPPSKVKGDPEYDDRMTQVVRNIRLSPPVDGRELIIQTKSTIAMHESDARLRPAQIEALYRIDERCVSPQPIALVLVDDMLTTGAHFKAAQSLLASLFPGVPTFGLFIARRALPDDESSGA